MKRAKRSTRRPAPGWQVYCQWFAEAPDADRARGAPSFAGDGEAYTTRAEAIAASWDEHEACAEHT